MENVINLFSHLIFISLVHQLLLNLFDWSKWIKLSPENIWRLRLFLLLVSIALGYLVSNFMLQILALSRLIFGAIS